ncbi:hypothetical protein [Streptomyces sp. NPDC056683]|uniref:hypothetical protein n=1 Tax=Streptomyces sp. NPDC056683 TaxID=3345910 RepID=UPI0036C1D8B6
MRIGIMGLARIGAFHTETLAGLGTASSLTANDPVVSDAGWMAEACTLSLPERRPVQIDEVRTP